MQEEEITKPDSRDMVLLVLYLYQTIPQLLPRTTLEFAGKLGDKQVRPWSCLQHMLPCCARLPLLSHGGQN